MVILGNTMESVFYRLHGNTWFEVLYHRLIKTQTRGTLPVLRPTPVPCARDSVTRACTDSRARKPLQLRDNSATLSRAWVVIVRHLDYILITRAGDGRWPRYQAKSLACPGCVLYPLQITLFKMATQRLQGLLDKIRVPLGGEKVYKDECAFSFDNPVSLSWYRSILGKKDQGKFDNRLSNFQAAVAQVQNSATVSLFFIRPLYECSLYGCMCFVVCCLLLLLWHFSAEHVQQLDEGCVVQCFQLNGGRLNW